VNGSVSPGNAHDGRERSPALNLILVNAGRNNATVDPLEKQKTGARGASPRGVTKKD